jgi:acyl-CoA hydrolase
LDEAVFLSPVKVGDSITFTARVVHAQDETFRVFVTVGVLDTTALHRLARFAHPPRR